VLAAHYGFTDEELDFIPSTALRAGINYDIKDRRAQNADRPDVNGFEQETCKIRD
jgi:hypothetical protein